MSQLALGTIGRSRSLINQSQESLDPGDHYDHSDREEEAHQQDADDEDDSGLVSLKLPNKRLITHTSSLYDSTFIPRPSNMLLILKILHSGRRKAAASPWQKQQEETEPSGIC